MIKWVPPKIVMLVVAVVAVGLLAPGTGSGSGTFSASPATKVNPVGTNHVVTTNQSGLIQGQCADTTNGSDGNSCYDDAVCPGGYCDLTQPDPTPVLFWVVGRCTPGGTPVNSSGVCTSDSDCPSATCGGVCCAGNLGASCTTDGDCGDGGICAGSPNRGTSDLTQTASSSGTASFTYMGGPKPGTDAILACLDVDKDPTDASELNQCFANSPPNDVRALVCKTWADNYVNTGGQGDSKNYSFGGMWAVNPDPSGPVCIADYQVVKHQKKGLTVGCHFNACTFEFKVCTAGTSSRLGRACSSAGDCGSGGFCSDQTSKVFQCNSAPPGAPCDSAPPPTSTANNARVRMTGGLCTDGSHPDINLHVEDHGEPGTGDKWGFTCGAGGSTANCGGIGNTGGNGYLLPNTIDHGNIQIHTTIHP